MPLRSARFARSWKNVGVWKRVGDLVADMFGFVEQLPDYVPRDPTLSIYDHGVAELRVAGELRAHLACVVEEMTMPAGQPWPWFVVVWPDGSKDPAFEDYGPKWCTVSELDEGFIIHGAEPAQVRSRRLFGMTMSTIEHCAEERRFEVEWLPAAEARERWEELGLEDSDF